MSKYLPITPDQIAEDAVKSWKAGAAIAHIHVREPETGRPTSDPDLFWEVCRKIKDRCDLILLPTTGGGPGMSLEEKIRSITRLEPEMCSFDPAPVQSGGLPIGGKIRRQVQVRLGKGISGVFQANNRYGPDL